MFRTVSMIFGIFLFATSASAQSSLTESEATVWEKAKWVVLPNVAFGRKREATFEGGKTISCVVLLDPREYLHFNIFAYKEMGGDTGIVRPQVSLQWYRVIIELELQNHAGERIVMSAYEYYLFGGSPSDWRHYLKICGLPEDLQDQLPILE